jgi:hypothetical protein
LGLIKFDVDLLPKSPTIPGCICYHSVTTS